jgi:L-lactate utilization protein LutC
MTPSQAATPAQMSEPAPVVVDVPGLGSDRFSQPVSEERLARTVEHLRANGFVVKVVHSRAQALEEVRGIIPKGAQVLNNTSATLEAAGIEDLILRSGEFQAVRPELMRLRAANDRDAMRRVGSAPEYAIGSVHAITEAGHVVIASGSGSQLAPYSYGAAHVIWVVGTQKIVTDLDEAFSRIYEHSLPLESDRVHRLYGLPGSAVSQILVVNREMMQPGRTTVILLTESIGF